MQWTRSAEDKQSMKLKHFNNTTSFRSYQTNETVLSFDFASFFLRIFQVPFRPFTCSDPLQALNRNVKCNSDRSYSKHCERFRCSKATNDHQSWISIERYRDISAWHSKTIAQRKRPQRIITPLNDPYFCSRHDNNLCECFCCP